MTAPLPVASDFTGSARTEAEAKIAYAAQRDYLAGLLGTDGLPATARDVLVLSKKNAYNAIIGGDFSTNPWQRGTSFVNPAPDTYTADRWKQYTTGSSVAYTITKAADAPSVAQAGVLATHCLQLDVTTADASIAAGDLSAVFQIVEGKNFLPLAQKPMMLSFWHKHTKAGTYCVSFSNQAQDRSLVLEYTQAVSDTWEKAELLVPASPSGGTWDYTNGQGLYMSFTSVGGSTFQTTAGTWQTGNFNSTSNQVNAFDSTSNFLRYALVQLEPGNVATEFAAEDVETTLHKCMRYYEIGAQESFGITHNSNDVFIHWRFKVPKRSSSPVGGTFATLANCLDETGTSGRTPSSINYTAYGADAMQIFPQGVTFAAAWRPVRLVIDNSFAQDEL